MIQKQVLKYLRINGIKKNHLASLLGIYPTQLTKWLNNEYQLNGSQMETIKDFLEGKHIITVERKTS